jgi:hypothetical protein
LQQIRAKDGGCVLDVASDPEAQRRSGVGHEPVTSLQPEADAEQEIAFSYGVLNISRVRIEFAVS